jgi:hypothetical protein
MGGKSIEIVVVASQPCELVLNCDIRLTFLVDRFGGFSLARRADHDSALRCLSTDNANCSP